MTDREDIERDGNSAAHARRRGILPQLPGLSISHCSSDNQHVVSLRGELDVATSSRLRRELQETQHGGVQTIVLDLSGLDFIDSIGVRLLLEVTSKGGYGSTSKILLTRGPEHIHRVLRIAGAEPFLPFID